MADSRRNARLPNIKMAQQGGPADPVLLPLADAPSSSPSATIVIDSPTRARSRSPFLRPRRPGAWTHDAQPFDSQTQTQTPPVGVAPRPAIPPAARQRPAGRLTQTEAVLEVDLPSSSSSSSSSFTSNESDSVDPAAGGGASHGDGGGVALPLQSP